MRKMLKKRRVFHGKGCHSYHFFTLFPTACWCSFLQSTASHSVSHKEKEKMSQNEKWELQFEHIDWNDIVDAELEGDVQALEDLK